MVSHGPFNGTKCKKFLLAVLPHKDNWDDGMVSVDPCIIDGFGKRGVAVINDDCTIGLSPEDMEQFLKCWPLFGQSPEHKFIQALIRALELLKGHTRDRD